MDIFSAFMMGAAGSLKRARFTFRLLHSWPVVQTSFSETMGLYEVANPLFPKRLKFLLLVTETETAGQSHGASDGR
jgi:hypothetical protein